MNPWSSYEHKPQLVQACVAAGVSWVALRRQPRPTGDLRLAARSGGSVSWRRSSLRSR